MGVLQGERVVFTGRLASMSRRRAEALVLSLGAEVTSSVSGRTTLVVIGARGWPLRPDGGLSVAIERAERLRARGSRLRVVSEDQFLELTGSRETREVPAKLYTAEQVSELVGADVAEIQRWERLGLVRADGEGRFDFQDIVSLRAISELIGRGVDPASVTRSLRSLAQFVTGTEHSIAQLRIVAEGSGELAAQIGEALVAPDGQHLFDFEKPVGPAPSQLEHKTDRAALAPPPIGNARAFLEQAAEWEEEERYDVAADLYRRAIARDPGSSTLHFNLANAVRLLGRAEAAEELYRLAVALDPENAVAWYNLADILEEDDRLEDAAACLREAVRASPGFADAHFNLATCLEAMEREDEAAQHWRAYLREDPTSEWSQIARARLAGA